MMLLPLLAPALLTAAALVAQSPDAQREALAITARPASFAFVTKPEVIRIRSQAELDAFAKRAQWTPGGKTARRHAPQLASMQVDFDEDQLVVICWGAVPYEQKPQLRVESVRRTGATIRIEARSHLRIGPASSKPRTAPEMLYPAQVVTVPRCKTVLVQLTGARLQQGAFQRVRSEPLIVSVAPDAMPLRAQARLLPEQDIDELFAQEPAAPHVRLRRSTDRQVVDIAWCRFRQEINEIEIEHIERRGDTLHVGVRACRKGSLPGSGSPYHRPRLRLEVPRTDKVAVHIRRSGLEISRNEPLSDFAPFTKGDLDVTVEDGSHAKPALRAGKQRKAR